MEPEVKQSEQARLLAQVSPAAAPPRPELVLGDGVFFTEGGQHVPGQRPDRCGRRLLVLQRSPDLARGR